MRREMNWLRRSFNFHFYMLVLSNSLYFWTNWLVFCRKFERKLVQVRKNLYCLSVSLFMFTYYSYSFLLLVAIIRAGFQRRCLGVILTELFLSLSPFAFVFIQSLQLVKEKMDLLQLLRLLPGNLSWLLFRGV